MHCTKCGTRIRDGHESCLACGNPVSQLPEDQSNICKSKSVLRCQNPACRDYIKEDWRFCYSCGFIISKIALTDTQNISTPPQTQQQKEINISTFVFLTIAILIIVITVNSKGNISSDPSSQPTEITSKNYHLYAPPDQTRFHALNAKYASIYNRGINEIQKSEAYNQLNVERTSFINQIQSKVNNWVGKVSISTPKGGGRVFIKVSSNIQGINIEYTNSLLTDFTFNREQSGGPVYNQLMRIPEGSFVRFSGEFTSDEEKSLWSEKGSVFDPEFSFKFSDVRVLIPNYQIQSRSEQRAITDKNTHTEAEKVKEAVEAAAGKLTLTENDKYEKMLKLNENLIYKSDQDHLKIENHFKTDTADVVLISEDCAGSACGMASYKFITITKSGSYIVSKEFGNGSIIDTKHNGAIITLIISENTNTNLKVTYNQGKLKSEKLRTNELIKKEEIESLYEIYLSCVEDACREFIDDEKLPAIGGPKALWQTWSAYSKDHRLNMNGFKNICKDSCISKNSISYSEFVGIIKK